MYRFMVLSCSLALTFSLAQKPADTLGATKMGDYLVEASRPSELCGIDKHGGVGQMTQRIFYRDRLVTSVAMTEFVSPVNPARLIFSISPSCGESEKDTGTFYFGGNGEPVQVNYGVISAAPEELKSLWSPDDRFLALPANGMEFFLVNLQAGSSDNLSKRYYEPTSLMSRVEFRGWSPDGKRLAVVVSLIISKPNGKMADESDLLSVDPATLNATYIASMRKKGGWSSKDFAWIAAGGTYELSVDPGLQGSLMIFTKAGKAASAEP